ncbi:hypothetical protein CFD26_103280 [Aspergillus turcosus]|uniref:DUF7730 domain-containing protein n=1 Tax=Aspergillus turcosus TaxID=1245748 RepID=A0A3R7HTL2_9EURO|nr:hypothetical protein CFD26_103280 [Aspergillus turcosus]
MRVNQPDKQDMMQLCPWWLEYLKTSPYLAMPADDEIAKVDYAHRDPNDDLTRNAVRADPDSRVLPVVSERRWYEPGQRVQVETVYKSGRWVEAMHECGLDELLCAGMTSNQTGLFFAKLPLEIRSEIYRYVLGGKTIHFARGRGDDPRPRHCVCLIRGRPSHLLVCRQGPAEEMYCHRASLPDGRGWQLIGEVQEEYPFRSRIPLLLTCRQIYSEAVILLALDNTINIQAQIVEQLQVVSEVRTFLPEKMFHAI